jgi:aminopeptidase N
MKKKALFLAISWIFFFLNGQECLKTYNVPLANLSRHIDLKYLKFQLQTQLDSLYFQKAVARWGFTIENSNHVKFYLDSQLVVDSVTYQNQSLPFLHANDILEIQYNFSVGGYHEVVIHYHGVPAQNGFGSVGFQVDTALWTLSEPYGAFTWLPNKEDLLDKIDSVDFEITVPSEFTVVANGVDLGYIQQGNQKTYFRKHRFPIAHYLIAFAVGKYYQQNFNFTYQNKNFELVNYVYEKDTAWASTETIHLIQFLTFLFDKFGEYPFYPEPYGQAQFGWGGGMEHQTVSFVGSWWIELLVHELAHQWFGDLVTCATWQDLWLNEGFATYLSGLYYEQIATQWWSIFKQQRMQSSTLEPLGSVYAYGTDTSNISTLFSKRLRYNKAAMVLHQLRFILGDTAFYQACYDYLHDPALRYRQVYTQDLKRHFQNHTSFDMDLYFQQWVYGEGYPNLFLHNQLKNNVLALQLEQQSSNPNIPWFDVPIPLKIYTKKQNIPFVVDTTIFFQSPSDTHYIAGIEVLDSIQIDPDLWIIKGTTSVVNRESSHSKNSLQIFPNPSHSEIMLNLTTNEKVTIYDLHGKKVLEKIYQPGQKIDISKLSSGVYYIQVQQTRVKWVKW